jgi:hypothetical protein
MFEKPNRRVHTHTPPLLFNGQKICPSLLLLLPLNIFSWSSCLLDVENYKFSGLLNPGTKDSVKWVGDDDHQSALLLRGKKEMRNFVYPTKIWEGSCCYANSFTFSSFYPLLCVGCCCFSSSLSSPSLFCKG